MTDLKKEVSAELETPRTDAFIKELENQLGDGPPCISYAAIDVAVRLRLVALARELEKELAEANKDAARYLWLRQQNWNESNLCAVRSPKEAVKLGYVCPRLSYLDALIDEAMK